MGISILQSAPPVSLSSLTPNDVGTTAAAGAASPVSREDHTHKLADSGWLTPSLQNGWLVYDATYGNAAMYRKIGPIVFLRGLVRSGTAGSVIFTLPVGFRPSIRMLFTVNSNSNTTTSRIDIDSTGTVQHQGTDTGYLQVSLSFVADA